MPSYKKGGFTLVELIVVITILAILGTIGFLSIQGYSANARDSKRVSDVSNIKKSLEFFILNSEKYPMPDEVGAASYSGSDIYYQGKVGENVTQNLSRNLKNVPRDPLTEETYIYSVTEKQNQYELTVVYENSIGYNQLIGDTYADLSDGVVSIDGNYNGLYVQTDTFAIPLPSITTAETLPLTLDSTNIQSQIVAGGSNKPSVGGAVAQTGGLDISLSVYSGKVDVTSSNTQKKAFIQAIQAAYSGSTLAQGGSIYEDVVSRTSDEELVSFANATIASNESEGIPEVLQCPAGQELSGDSCMNQSYTFGSNGNPILPSNAVSPTSVTYDSLLTSNNLGTINCSSPYVSSTSPALGYYFDGQTLVVQGSCNIPPSANTLFLLLPRDSTSNWTETSDVTGNISLEYHNTTASASATTNGFVFDGVNDVISGRGIFQSSANDDITYEVLFTPTQNHTSAGRYSLLEQFGFHNDIGLNDGTYFNLNGSWSMRFYNGGSVLFNLHHSAFGHSDVSAGSASWSVNNIQHMAVTKSGRTIKIYVNGVKTGERVLGADSAIGFDDKAILVGFNDENNGYFQGTIHAVRIKKDIVYDQNFTIPTVSDIITQEGY